jgi:hypothetical protein
MVDANDMLRPLDGYVPGAEPGRWVSGGEGWRIEKRYALEGDALTVTFRVEGARPPASLETEINLAMPSCDGFGGRYVLADGSVAGRLRRPSCSTTQRRLTLDDSELRGCPEHRGQPAGATRCRAASYGFAVRGRLREDHAGGLHHPGLVARPGDQRITLSAIPAS